MEQFWLLVNENHDPTEGGLMCIWNEFLNTPEPLICLYFRVWNKTEVELKENQQPMTRSGTFGSPVFHSRISDCVNNSKIAITNGIHITWKNALASEWPRTLSIVETPWKVFTVGREIVIPE